jgi:hypothetical protein
MVNKKGGILCHEEMEQDLLDKDLEQEKEWAEAVVEEAEWAAIGPVQARQGIACAPIAVRRFPINRAIPVTTWFALNADQK